VGERSLNPGGHFPLGRLRERTSLRPTSMPQLLGGLCEKSCIEKERNHSPAFVIPKGPVHGGGTPIYSTSGYVRKAQKIFGKWEGFVGAGPVEGDTEKAQERIIFEKKEAYGECS